MPIQVFPTSTENSEGTTWGLFSSRIRNYIKFTISKGQNLKLVVIAHVWNLSIQEDETGGSFSSRAAWATGYYSAYYSSLGFLRRELAESARLAGCWSPTISASLLSPTVASRSILPLLGILCESWDQNPGPQAWMASTLLKIAPNPPKRTI